LAEFKLDEFYTSASFVEAARAAPIGFNLNPIKDFLLRVAGDKNGDVSAKRLGEWLNRNCGRVVLIDHPNGDAGRYWMVKGRNRTNTATFMLSEIG
jgi:hypothetical protein